jgi:hypothetical protein
MRASDYQLWTDKTALYPKNAVAGLKSVEKLYIKS